MSKYFEYKQNEDGSFIITPNKGEIEHELRLIYDAILAALGREIQNLKEKLISEIDSKIQKFEIEINETNFSEKIQISKSERPDDDTKKPINDHYLTLSLAEVSTLLDMSYQPVTHVLDGAVLMSLSNKRLITLGKKRLSPKGQVILDRLARDGIKVDISNQRMQHG